MNLRPLALSCAALAAAALAASGVGLAETGRVGVWAVNAGWTLAGLVAFTGTAAAALRVGRNRVGRAWLLWASGAGVWLLGALVGDVLMLAGVSTGPALTVLWSLFALLSIAGLAYRSAPGAFSFQLSLLDALPAVLAVTAVSVASAPLAGSDWLDTFSILAAALYALLGLVGLQILAWMAARALNMWILVAGFALTATAGLAGAGQGHAGGALHGRWSDPLWTLGLIIIGLAGFRRALAPASYTRLFPVEREHGSRSLPAAGAILGLMLTAAFTLGRHQLYLWLALAGFVSFAVRTYFVRRANSSARDELARLTLLDPLTELLNRRGLERALSSEIERSKRDGSTLQALLIDVDNLKQINDALGHAVGDMILQEVGKAVMASSRSTAQVARIGGDEFVALLPNTTSADAIRVAERIRLAIAGIILSSRSHTTLVTVSLGIVQVSEELTAIDELLSEAHPILRKSKRAGKNRVSSEPEERDRAHVLTLSQVAAQLQHEDALRAVMQPIVRLADRQIVGYEFLARSSVPGYELPDDFFPASLEANALTLVDHRCFNVCLATAGRLGGTLQSFVNLFPSTLIELPVERLVGALPTDPVRRGCCIEISEQQIVGDPSCLVAPVRALKEAGFRIALDDVGFGRSTLEGLLLLEPETVKLDRKCIDGVAQDLTKLRALKRLLDVGQALGADVVAEGIESAEDLKVLRKLGVAYGQGFLFGGPLDPAHYLASSSEAAADGVSARSR